ncbi:hypothetical protein XELAEV_18038905mg [Xenopus laevis]|uniref:Uncharacterized protein n=1 Tax=Xenopus laevis TaxID=8355 RepID=A0A974H7U6_XENLA|nr:hypothetical protein XELAEV_18038905mg [Xenopus laevis]
MVHTSNFQGKSKVELDFSYYSNYALALLGLLFESKRMICWYTVDYLTTKVNFIFCYLITHLSCQSNIVCPSSMP